MEHSDNAFAPALRYIFTGKSAVAEAERVIVTGSNIPTAEEFKHHHATTELFVSKIHGQTRSSRREAVIRRQYRREIRRRTQS